MSFSCQRGGGGGLDHDRGFSVFLAESSNMFVDHWMLDQEGYYLCFSIAILWKSLVLGFQADRLGCFLVGIESWRGEGAQQLPILLLSENFTSFISAPAPYGPKYTISDSVPHRTASSLPPLKQDISSSSSTPPSKYLSHPALQNSTSSVLSPVSFQANRQSPDPNCDSSQNIPHV